MARLILPKFGEKPHNEGEKRVLEYLLNHLSPSKADGNYYVEWDDFQQKGPEYIVIPNIEIPDKTGRYLEIDAIVIAPHACYVIETKNWGPLIQGDDHTWFLNNLYERKNPHKSLNYKCRVLRSLVGNESADLSYKVWYQGVVVIAREPADLRLEGKMADYTFTLNHQLSSFLKDPNMLSAARIVEEGQISVFQQELVRIITGKGKTRSSKPLVIQGYRVEEKLLEREGLVEYLGRINIGNKKGALKRIRVFSLPYLENPEKRKEQEEKILRDFEALETLGTHPNIVGYRGTFNSESGEIIEILDWSETGTLRGVMKSGTLTFDEKVSIVKGIANGLKAAHENCIIHRDVTPDNVLMTPNGPQLMNFDKAYMTGSGKVTVWQTVDMTMDRRYLPPELSTVASERDAFLSSDIYSLGVLFYELICGTIPYEGPEGLEAEGGKLPDAKLPSKVIPGIPGWLDEIISHMYAWDTEHRYEKIDVFFEALEQKLTLSPSPTSQQPPSKNQSTEKISTPKHPNQMFSMGERVLDYRITRHIKSGGFSQVYEAVHVLQDTTYALKIYNESVYIDSLIIEFRHLNNLSHPHIVNVYWSGQIPGGRYYLTMEYLQGESLQDYAYGTKKLVKDEILNVGTDILSALRYLHETDNHKGKLTGKSLYHRDIKPSNIINEPRRGYVLIDFNISKEASSSSTFAGTGRYIAPDLIKGTRINWDPSGDTFALGVTLYELVCKYHPYKNNEPHLHIPPLDPHETEEGKNLSAPVCAFLSKSVQPRSEDRFRTAREMESAFLKLKTVNWYKSIDKEVKNQTRVQIDISETEKNRKNYNPYVNRFRTLFSQARNSNAGTRGLDEIARKTYIPTKLDTELLPEILAGEFKLVIITGNAGDGKTALIQQLEQQSENLERFSSENGSRFTIKGVPFISNYDGSQDEGDKNNDQVLEEFLQPFVGLKDISAAREGRILAINEGRLVEFLAAPNRKEQYGYLYEAVDLYFIRRAEQRLPHGMIIVNLNWRSVVAGSTDDPSILEKQLKILLEPEFWSACQDCDFKNKCFIYYNAASLGDPAAGPVIRQRMLQLFEAVHLRRQLHITMRDLRSALSFMIIRDKGCEEIPGLLNHENGFDYAGLFYWNITDETAKDAGNNDRLITLLRQLDLGKVPQPPMDRDMHFLPMDPSIYLGTAQWERDYSYEILNSQHRKILDFLPGENDEKRLVLIKRHHRMVVRKLFFEGRDRKVVNRLPYRNINNFKKILQDDRDAQQKAKIRIVYAISLSEGCREKGLAQGNICISADKDPRWYSFRLFPERDFQLKVPHLGELGRYLEHTPDRFLLEHNQDKTVTLEINLDMFELLNYMVLGFKPSLNDLHGKYIELIIFKNTLEHLPYRSVVLSEDLQSFYQIKTDESNKLILSEYG